MTEACTIEIKDLVIRHGLSVELMMMGKRDQSILEKEYDLYKLLADRYPDCPYFLKPNFITEEGGFYRLSSNQQPFLSKLRELSKARSQTILESHMKSERLQLSTQIYQKEKDPKEKDPKDRDGQSEGDDLEKEDPEKEEREGNSERKESNQDGEPEKKDNPENREDNEDREKEPERNDDPEKEVDAQIIYESRWRMVDSLTNSNQEISTNSNQEKIEESVHGLNEPPEAKVEWVHSDIYDHSNRGQPKDEPVQSSLWEYVMKIADAMQLLHDAGVIHRNLTPDNIDVAETIIISNLIAATRNDAIQPIPFFAGAIYADKSHYSIIGDSSINRTWTAPEVLADTTKSSFASDMYSFGLLVNYIMTGSVKPILPENEDSVPSHLRSYDLLIRDCLHPDPSERPLFNDEFKERLHLVGESLRNQTITEWIFDASTKVIPSSHNFCALF